MPRGSSGSVFAGQSVYHGSRTVADAGSMALAAMAVTLSLRPSLREPARQENAIRGAPNGNVVPTPNVGRGAVYPEFPGTRADNPPIDMAYIANQHAEAARTMDKVVRRLKEVAETFDSYRPQSLGGESCTQLNILLDYELQEARTIVVTGPTILATGNNGTAFTLQLGGRAWQLLLPPTGILTERFNPGLLLKRSDLNQLISATAGNWAVEITGYRSDQS